MLRNATFHRIFVSFFLLEHVVPLVAPSLNYALMSPGQLGFKSYELLRPVNIININVFKIIYVFFMLVTTSSSMTSQDHAHAPLAKETIEQGSIMNHYAASADSTILTCSWRQATIGSLQSSCILGLAAGKQEVENKYITNISLYTRILQYLNYDISHDVYLRLPNQLDSVAAITASYPRQYGSTGRSSVLLVFPISEKQLRHGCSVTFKGEKLEVGTHRFVFTAQDIKAAQKGAVVTK